MAFNHPLNSGSGAAQGSLVHDYVTVVSEDAHYPRLEDNSFQVLIGYYSRIYSSIAIATLQYYLLRGH